jgi:hypothetical protein
MEGTLPSIYKFCAKLILCLNYSINIFFEGIFLSSIIKKKKYAIKILYRVRT